MKQQLICFIGRFQPWHLGHMHVLKRALKSSSHVLILCGSSNVSPSYKNPWNFQERMAMISSTLSKADSARVAIKPLPDLTFNNQAWLELIATTIAKTKEEFALAIDTPIAWIGHHKDSSSDYLDYLPGESYTEVAAYKAINASDIRNSIAFGKLLDVKTKLAPVVYNTISNVKLASYDNSEAIMLVAFKHNNKIMFLQGDNGWHLPGCCAYQKMNMKNIFQAYVSCWYSESDFIDKKTITLGDTIVFQVMVQHAIADSGLSWFDVDKLKSELYYKDHASIAYHILELD